MSLIQNKDIVFCRVPSHNGGRGNEKADSAERSALDLPRAKVGVPYITILNIQLISIFFSLGKMIGIL